MAPLKGRDVRRFNLSSARAAGGIVSSLMDATKWERALYEGRMLPRRQQRELEGLVSQNTGTPIKRARKYAGYGLGVGQEVLLPRLGVVWFYEGESFGYRMLHIYVPRSGTLFAVAVNSAVGERKDKLNGLAQSVFQILHDAGAA
jgi:D-alanyl-D-alanine carboxypeptidase